MYFNLYELLYFSQMLKEFHHFCTQSELDFWVIGFAYKTKVINTSQQITLNDPKVDNVIFKNCSSDNIYVQAHEFFKKKEKEKKEKKEKSLHECLETFSVSVESLNTLYWKQFNVVLFGLQYINKPVGDDNISKILVKIYGEGKKCLHKDSGSESPFEQKNRGISPQQRLSPPPILSLPNLYEEMRLPIPSFSSLSIPSYLSFPGQNCFGFANFETDIQRSFTLSNSGRQQTNINEPNKTLSTGFGPIYGKIIDT